MDFFTSLQHQLDALQRIVGGAPATGTSPAGPSATGSIPERLHRLSDGDLQDALEIATSIQRQAERLRHSSTSVLAQRTHMAAQTLRTHAASSERRPSAATHAQSTNMRVRA
ncbi:hypothetical protein [Leucobacter salsicius]|uniref:hypothetical protein n=1 Tax=Leucobacter salsicius TaxID=664638 RepID=UPI0003462F90|nr:hypothetical protein [Leucobacter salsicius]